MFKTSGYLPSPPGLTYKSFKSISSPLLKQAGATVQNEVILNESTPISNQYQIGSCVCNATSDALEILLGLEGRPVVQLSRMFLYWNSRMYNKQTDQDNGTYIHNAFDSLKRLGICPEDAWPYDPMKVFVQPSLSAYKTANDNTIEDFYRIDSNGNDRLNDIETALSAQHPVVFATGVGKSFQNAFPNQVFSRPDHYDGLHAMIITGYRHTNGTRQYWIRNSWGSTWANNGHVWVDSSYIDWDTTHDIWVPTRVPDLLF